MRTLLYALCLASLLQTAGCSRPAAAPQDAEPPTGAVTLVPPPAQVAPPPAPTALGEDADGKVLDTAALTALEAALRDTDPLVRRGAVKRLAGVRWKFPEPVSSILKQALADNDAETRLAALRLAAADPLRTPDIVRLLRDTHRPVQVTAAQLLIAQGKHQAEAYAALAGAVADRTTENRAALVQYLRAKAPASNAAVPALLAVALDGQDPLRVEAIETLAGFGPSQEPLDALLVLAHDPDVKVRGAAVRALGKLDAHSAKVQVTLVRALRDSHVAVSLAAMDSIGPASATPATVSLLIERLRDGDERVRYAAVRALGRCGAAAWSAVPELQRLSQGDPVLGIRQGAAAAERAIVPPLEARP